MSIFKKILNAILLLPIYFYRAVISPLTPPSCRHYPSCSVYSIDALKLHGPIRGLPLLVNRIFRCNQWGTAGVDPVPKYLFKKYKKISLNKYPTENRLKRNK